MLVFHLVEPEKAFWHNIQRLGPKMSFTPKLEQKFLNVLYKRYSSNYGYGVRNLNKCIFWLTSAASFEAEIPEIAVTQNGIKIDFLVDWVKELEARGLVKINPHELKFVLTEKGYHQASLGGFGKAMAFLNNNQGLAIPISILSFIVSIIALFTDS